MAVKITMGGKYKIVFRGKFVDFIKPVASGYYLNRVPYNPIKYFNQLILSWHGRWYDRRIETIEECRLTGDWSKLKK